MLLFLPQGLHGFLVKPPQKPLSCCPGVLGIADVFRLWGQALQASVGVSFRHLSSSWLCGLAGPSQGEAGLGAGFCKTQGPRVRGWSCKGSCPPPDM